MKPRVVFLFLAAGFVYGVIHLFALRFEAGDVYPEYSSLRADPLGLKGFYDALDELPHMQTFVPGNSYDRRQLFLLRAA